MKSIGFCLGASNVSMVELEKDENCIKITRKENKPHDGNAKAVLEQMFEEYNLKDINNIAVTGRKFRSFTNFSSISEPEAIEYAYEFVKDKYNNPSVIVSAGGETFMVYELDKNGKIINVLTGNKCASGTGEFFLQQIKRMNIDIDTANKVANINNPHIVSGRCSVFCKSDCTHALNKGQSKGRVIAGLCKMMAGKILELLKKTRSKNVLLIGGTAKNRLMVEYLLQEIPDVKVSEEAEYFEALGTSLWALNNDTNKVLNKHNIFKDGQSSFSFLPALKDYTNKVTFKSMEEGTAKENDTCIIGLDVGSTTTKAIILRISDNAILGSIYLRTNGDPIKASRECYEGLDAQINVPINIIGLGVTGSGRQIAGLHALTEGIINEIIAHATAAVYFDRDVDTIFEIGGQDAKYTYITNKVPSDYAMNEACSAGTGSFLEEAARESMGIDTLKIADIAISATNPPNFNDQCAAFISSDIKTAIQEGINRDDIVAGLVYSICQNYSNRVKGNRAVGKKIFMQGGVCYNKAVPIAMAAFTGNEIIVPPEPGLMGAFGVALEVKNKIGLGLMKKQNFDLKELANRNVKYANTFACNGGKEKCDRGCTINLIEIKGNKYPFGGSCNKYVNLIRNVEYDCEQLDLVMLRENLAFIKYAPFYKNNPEGKKIGLSKSLLTNTLYPLYYTFFTSLGLNVILGDKLDYDSMEKKGAPFCYPVELAHGFMGELLKSKLDYIFLPQVMGMYVENGIPASVVCPLAQGEPYYLKTAFNELKNIKVISPTLNFSKGYLSVANDFVTIGQELGFSKSESMQAYKQALKTQMEYVKELQEIGLKVLKNLESNPKKIAVVMFGRPYNAFTRDANMGIPHKFASRGYITIPFEFLPYTSQEPVDQMYWAMGQSILKAAKYVSKHPQLYGTYITNFSCGPDSFLVNYFRDIMGQKPSLTLELDSHTADAGIDTRIEAFLDVVKSYMEINNTNKNEVKDDFLPATTKYKDGTLYIVDSKGKYYSLNHKKVHLLLPSMGDMGSRCIAASFRHVGINTTCLDVYTENELKVGRANSSCKECLPLMLTMGGLLNYLEEREQKDEVLVYFMPNTCGPCRFGQYNTLIKNVIQKNKIKNVALLSLNSENGYAGLGAKFQLRAWRAIVISDVLNAIYSAILVLSEDKQYGLKIFDEVCRKIINSIASESWLGIQKTLIECAKKLSAIPRKQSFDEAKKVALVGEIFVRHDSFSAQYMIEKLAQKDIIIKIAPMVEWIYYCDYRIRKRVSHLEPEFKTIAKTIIQGYFKRSDERVIKKIMEGSGFYEANMVDVDKIISNVEKIISPKLTGEAILTTGVALTEIVDEVSGVIAIAPFGCMPNRISEAVIGSTINTEKINITHNNEVVKRVLEEHPSLPFLAIETDGNVFPQIIQAKLETFCLQVDRVHKSIVEQKGII